MNSVFSRRRMLQAMSAAAVFSISSDPRPHPQQRTSECPPKAKTHQNLPGGQAGP